MRKPSLRQARVGDLLRETLADLLLRKVKEHSASGSGSTTDENQRFIVQYAGDSQKDIGDAVRNVHEQKHRRVSWRKPERRLRVDRRERSLIEQPHAIAGKEYPPAIDHAKDRVNIGVVVDKDGLILTTALISPRQEKITVIANFPDERIFPILPYPDVSSDIRMIYYGSIAERFGLLDVLEAIARVRDRGRLSVRIVGEGEAAEDIQRAIGDLGLERTVVFENRTYPLGELPKLVGTHHLGLVPYKPSPATNYMLPVKLLELAAMGIPAICVANVPIRRYFADSAFFAYDNARPASLTDLIERILERPSLLLEKRRALLQDRDNRLWNGERRKYLDVLEELSGGGTR